MSFASGTLVRARGREWVVLPESEPDLLLLRPLGGADGEIAGVMPALEPVEPAHFAPPDPALAGDARSAGLLRDALRLGFRSSAGPFRSFGRIAVDPRPYQLVPLLMALPMNPVRLLIADDVGVGKTVEAALIARELLDQGTVARLAVLCPPHLAEQWQRELREKLHIEAEVVLSSTARRLERGLGVGESLFDAHPFVVVSTEYIKADRRRAEFVRSCPELVIVDEAHGFAWAASRQRACASAAARAADRARPGPRAPPPARHGDAAQRPGRRVPLAVGVPRAGARGPARGARRRSAGGGPPAAGSPPGAAAAGRHPPLHAGGHAVPGPQVQGRDLPPRARAARTARPRPRVRSRDGARAGVRCAAPAHPLVVGARPAARARLKPARGSRHPADARRGGRCRDAGGGRRARTPRGARRDGRGRGRRGVRRRAGCRRRPRGRHARAPTPARIRPRGRGARG